MISVVKLVCSVCDADNPLVTKTEAGLVIMCKDCMELGVLSEQERKIHGKELNIYKPETFRHKPATSLIFLHSYFKIHPEATKH